MEYFEFEYTLMEMEGQKTLSKTTRISIPSDLPIDWTQSFIERLMQSAPYAIDKTNK